MSKVIEADFLPVEINGKEVVSVSKGIHFSPSPAAFLS